ncbi:exodeoxyribonuclease V subunit gamma [Mycoavidus sp. B2-EB]|uniref:exodeoxyribonuclease V subunit gamma n=1 Tax=Mycoavidus sp. B2-EB TaxID=2651972 RepID=UPI0016286C77|nr:exodeoxyribonuclease V subunit gamma [Mycoavidus sp. B2-EB]BBO59526.1 RecBCD enzyme subunit RecC [Mycoavidus sp. B2-EB]
MFKLFYSNRYETLAQALLDDLAADPLDPWSTPSIIVPSVALRRRLELDIATRFGICMNVDFAYLAQWLWAQLGRIYEVPKHSPFASEQLVWHCYRWLDARRWPAEHNARLSAYLQAADATMRYELAQRVALLFEQYLTYRPDWLNAWYAGHSPIALRTTAPSSNDAGTQATWRSDEAWQAQLWRRLFAELAAPGETAPAAYRFLTEAATLKPEAVARAAWPKCVRVFALPTIPPLHLALLRELARWIEVRLYLMNPCREYWHDIVDAARVSALALDNKVDYHETGNVLLAEWGKQTQAQLHLLQELSEGALSTETALYIENEAPTWLAALQNAILNLQRWPVPPAAGKEAETGVEVHVCHSLMRQLEVLHDRLLGLFDANPAWMPADVLVVLPNLTAAAPLIDAVFGATDSKRHIPYRITGLPRLQSNPMARVLYEMLELPARSIGVVALIEWLRTDALAARYAIRAEDKTQMDAATSTQRQEGGGDAVFETIRLWLASALARRGLAPAHEVLTAQENLSAPERHTFADALMRLYLGYALPAGALPLAEYLPMLSLSGAQASLLGSLSRFIDDLAEFADACAQAHSATAWRAILLNALERFFAIDAESAQPITELRDIIIALTGAIAAGDATQQAIPAAVLRMAFGRVLNEPARGGVPTGGVTFSALTSLRGLPYRVVCILEAGEGVLPGKVRTDEFDLMAAFSQAGDRQRRDDERAVFLDLVLAARNYLLLAYTGRSIRDNTPLPSAAVVSELLDYLSQALAGPNATQAEMVAARARLVIEHPLQAFAVEYLNHESRLFTYDPDRAEIASALRSNPSSAEGHALPFFSAPLPLEDSQEIFLDDFERFWQHPGRALLRDRLGIALAHAPREQSDFAPFALEYAGRDALAKRLLPGLLAQGDTPPETSPANQTQSVPKLLFERASRIALASPELPDGATGVFEGTRELNALAALAARIRAARAAGVASYPFAFELEPKWPAAPSVCNELAAVAALDARIQFTGVLENVSQEGLLLYRSGRPNARDYLSAWLCHLVLCELAPEGVKPRTVWLGDSTDFTLNRVQDARRYLNELIALYRVGRCAPLHFFPKSAWALMSDGEDAARRIWVGNQGTASHSVAEMDDIWFQLMLRGESLEGMLDARFKALAQTVFAPLLEHLELARSR